MFSEIDIARLTGFLFLFVLVTTGADASTSCPTIAFWRRDCCNGWVSLGYQLAMQEGMHFRVGLFFLCRFSSFHCRI